MLFNKLGRTNLEVSKICLGTMTWGQQNTEAEAQLAPAMPMDGFISQRTEAMRHPAAATETLNLFTTGKLWQRCTTAKPL